MITRSFVTLLVLLVFSLGIQVNSHVPAELPFVVIFGLMFLCPVRQVLLLAAVTGCALDLFSPIKGLSFFSYMLAVTVCFLLGRHLLTNRSLPVFLVMGMSGWICLVVCKWFLFVGLSLVMGTPVGALLVSGESLGHLGRGFFTTLGSLFLFYPLLLDAQPTSRKSSFSPSL